MKKQLKLDILNTLIILKNGIAMKTSKNQTDFFIKRKKTFYLNNFVILTCLILTGCASILDGDSQEIKIKTTPPGATCQFIRKGEVIGSIAETPGSLLVKKTKEDIFIICKKEGHTEVKHHLKSEIGGATFWNIVAGGGIGWAIDSASGADNKYDELINITLTPIL